MIKKPNSSIRLPVECVEGILQFLEDDIESLHSCVLVNRLWCRSGISLLWSQPFSFVGRRAHKIIDVYILFLTDEKKEVLTNIGFNNIIDSDNNNDNENKKTLFNYPKFFKRLDINGLRNSIRCWLINYYYDNLKHAKIYVAFIAELDDRLVTDREFEIVGNLFIDLTEYSSRIEYAHIDFNGLPVEPIDLDEFDSLISLFLESQNSLKDLTIAILWSNSAASLVMQSLSSDLLSNSLRYLKLHQLSQNSYHQLLSILHLLNNLETLQIIGFYEENIEDLKEFSDDDDKLKPINLKNLHYEGSGSEYDIFISLHPIIIMSSSNLKTLSTDFVTTELLETISKYCVKLTHLSISLIINEIPEILFSLFDSLKNLNHLSIYTNSADVPFTSTENLSTFSRKIPKTLKYFGFDFLISPDILDFFLKECRASLQALAIYRSEMVNEELLIVIEKHFKEKKSLKRLLIDPPDCDFQMNKYEIPIISGTIDPCYPFSGPSTKEYENKWDKDIFVDFDNEL
nr:154_t:CDS:2 [Entrophospora candida]CAG8584634.1 1550_t:CDS:2 [Entrophospora candida]